MSLKHEQRAAAHPQPEMGTFNFLRLRIMVIDLVLIVVHSCFTLGQYNLEIITLITLNLHYIM